MSNHHGWVKRRGSGVPQPEPGGRLFPEVPSYLCCCQVEIPEAQPHLPSHRLADCLFYSPDDRYTFNSFTNTHKDL